MIGYVSFPNGCSTGAKVTADALVKNKIVSIGAASNYWSSTENSQNNSWNVNFSSGNFNNNNKYNSNYVRPIVALAKEYKEGWIRAYLDCCKHKYGSVECLYYRIYCAEDVLNLALETYNGTYKPTTSSCFCVTVPKLREVFAANFRDRIVHHWICMRLEPLFEQRFIDQKNVSFNCRKGFGVSAALDRIEYNLRQTTGNYTRSGYVGKFDYKSFFMSIDKEVLISLLIPFIRENYHGDDVELLIHLTTITIRHNPAKDCVRRGNIRLWDCLPHNKSLFYMDGMAIGNLPSQQFANFYLSFVDEYALKLCSDFSTNGEAYHYVRFVDDFCIDGTRKDVIIQIYRMVADYALVHLHISVHPDKVYLQHISKGVKIIGSVIKPGRRYLSNRTIGHMLTILHRADSLALRSFSEPENPYPIAKMEHIVCALNSYLGFFLPCQSYALRRKIFSRRTPFRNFIWIKGRFTIIKLSRRRSLGNLLLSQDVLIRYPRLVDASMSGTVPIRQLSLKFPPLPMKHLSPFPKCSPPFPKHFLRSFTCMAPLLVDASMSDIPSLLNF